jgi:hypothetical protein
MGALSSPVLAPQPRRARKGGAAVTHRPGLLLLLVDNTPFGDDFVGMVNCTWVEGPAI